MRRGQVHEMSSRRKHNSQHHQTLLILTYRSLAWHLQQFHQRAQEPFCSQLNAATLGWSVLMP